MSPAEGTTFGATSVTITGTGFAHATGVAFGVVPASSFSIDSDTQITAISPEHLSGSVDVFVTSADGTNVPTNADRFAYDAPATIYHCGVITASQSWLAESVHIITCQVTVSANALLTIEPGTVVKSTGAALQVAGSLHAAATVGSPVIFTSIDDNTVGGITGTGAPTAGNWQGILQTNSPMPAAEVSLANAEVRYANLAGANLAGANLSGVLFESVIGTPAALPSGWFTLTGHLMGPGANLRNVNLTGSDLSGVNLTGADLTGSDLTGSNVSYAFLSNAILNDVNLTGSNVSYTDLAGASLRGVNLTGANISYANLTSADLTGVNLTGANISYANLTGADLTGVNFTGANVAGINLTGAIGYP